MTRSSVPEDRRRTGRDPSRANTSGRNMSRKKQSGRNMPEQDSERAPGNPSAWMITGVALFLLAVFMIYLLIATPANLTSVINTVRGMGGVITFLLPAWAILAGIDCCRTSLGHGAAGGRKLAGNLMAMLLYAVVHIFSTGDILQGIRNNNYFNFIRASFEKGSADGTGGGAFGAVIAWPVHAVLGTGLGAAALILLLIACFFLSGVASPVARKLNEMLAESRERREIQDAEWEEERRAQEEEEKRAAEEEARERRRRDRAHDTSHREENGSRRPRRHGTDEEILSDMDREKLISQREGVRHVKEPSRPLKESPVRRKAEDASSIPGKKPGSVRPADTTGMDIFDLAEEKEKSASRRRKQVPEERDEVTLDIPAAKRPVPGPMPVIEDDDPIFGIREPDTPVGAIPEGIDPEEVDPEEVIPEEIPNGKAAAVIGTVPAESAEATKETEEDTKEEIRTQQVPVRFTGRTTVVVEEAVRTSQPITRIPVNPVAPAATGKGSGKTEPVKKTEAPKQHDAQATFAPAEASADEERPYNYPTLDLLATGEDIHREQQIANQSDNEKKELLRQTLESFGIRVRISGTAHGPAVTRFELVPPPGIRVSKITGLSDDIALSLAAKSIRIEAPIPGKSAVGVEIPNDKIMKVCLRDVLESPAFKNNPSRVAIGLGMDNAGNYIVGDIAKMPHVLIAGQTGSGKSVCINSIIMSILYRAKPNEVQMILIDPKVVELSVYNDIPHLITPVVTDPKKAANALNWAVGEMEHRYQKFAESGVRDIKGYNRKIGPGGKIMTQIVIIIDELADLMMVSRADVESSICRLAQLARAAGMHLVIATQRPSVDVVTGLIKANIPSRIAFSVASQVDSRTMIDHGGAEKLLGNGDMLYLPNGANVPNRVQGTWVSDDEVQAVVDYIKQDGEPNYDPDLMERMERDEKSDAEKEEEDAELDDKLEEAIRIVIDAQQASTSMLQRRMRIGYARAGRLIDEMEKRGIVGPSEGSKPRKVLMTREGYERLSSPDSAEEVPDESDPPFDIDDNGDNGNG